MGHTVKKLSKEELETARARANRRGNREAELENATGFVSKSKAFKNKKAYSRKLKLAWE